MNLRVRAARSNETSADIADAFVYAAENGAKIVNASLAERGFSQYLQDAIAAHPETLYVIAAGNNAYSLDSPANTSYPCAYPADNIVCVAATGRKDELASFSNWSPTTRRPRGAGHDHAVDGAGDEHRLERGLRHRPVRRPLDPGRRPRARSTPGASRRTTSRAAPPRSPATPARPRTSRAR